MFAVNVIVCTFERKNVLQSENCWIDMCYFECSFDTIVTILFVRDHMQIVCMLFTFSKNFTICKKMVYELSMQGYAMMSLILTVYKHQQYHKKNSIVPSRRYRRKLQTPIVCIKSILKQYFPLHQMGLQTSQSEF